MCGRYSFVPSPIQITEELADIEKPDELPVRYNIAPTQQALVITNDAPGQLQALQWGLIPHWSRDGANGGKLINARMEGLADKPSFRLPFRRRRCLVPADSFYEWRTELPKRKIPYRIFRQDGQLMFFAGLWDEWRDGDGVKRTFTIITTSPSPDVEPLHDRMPVILTDPGARQRWLEPIEPEEALELLQTPREGLLTWYRVSEQLNSPMNEKPELHERVNE
ncbi:MAG: SOS response-associated peptidase [Phycisphaerae bacterium]|nr:SOS response-associated peptidase [Saprospiraceae bacterium]